MLSILGFTRVAGSSSRWARNFLTSSMATGASTSPRVQASSQKRGQTLPQTAGKGFSRLMSSSASSNLPWEASFM